MLQGGQGEYLPVVLPTGAMTHGSRAKALALSPRPRQPPGSGIGYSDVRSGVGLAAHSDCRPVHAEPALKAGPALPSFQA